MPIAYSLSGKGQNMQMGTANPGTLRAAHPSAGFHVHGSRNKVASMQQYPSDSQNTSSTFSNFRPVNLGVPEPELHANDATMRSGLDNNQKLFLRHASQNLAGNVGDGKMNRTFPTNQVPNGCALLGPADAQLGGPVRVLGMTELQLLQQHALHRKQQQDLQVKQNQAMRLQKQEALMMKREILIRQQQQDVSRSQLEAVMHLKQQEALRMQQQLLRLKQQGASRTEELNAALWSQEQVGSLSKQQDKGLLPQQQQSIWSQQPNTLWCQQGSGQRKNLQAQLERAWSGNQHQLTHYQQVSSLNQCQASHFQQVQALQRQQSENVPKEQLFLDSQQPNPMCIQQHMLQNSHQQSSQSYYSQFSSSHNFGIPSQQELLKTSQQALPQETFADFPGTSYSDLLHGPDTPPSQTPSGFDTSFSDLAGNTAAFPPANSQTVVLPTYGSSLQGLPREALQVQDLVRPEHIPPPCFSHIDQNPALAGGDGRKGTQTEYPVFSSRAVSPVNAAFELSKSRNGDFGAGGLVSVSNSVFDDKARSQESAKPSLQTSNYSSAQSMRLNGLLSAPTQADLLSQSQQHFQGRQVSRQRSWECLAQKHGVSKATVPEVCPPLSRSISSIEKNTALESRDQQFFCSVGTGRVSPGHDFHQIGGTDPDTAITYRPQKILKTAIEAMSRTFYNEEEPQGTESLSSIEPLACQDVGHHLHGTTAARNIIGQKQVTLMVEQAAPLSPSGSLTQAIQRVNPETILSTEIPSQIMAAGNDLFDDDNTELKEKEASGLTLSDLVGSGYSKGLGKHGTTISESIFVRESTSQIPKGHLNDYTRKHGYLIDEASSNFQTNMQDNSGKQMLEKRSMGNQIVFQELHGRRPIDTPIKAQSLDMAAGNHEALQSRQFDSSTWHQGSTFEKVKLSEFLMDPSCSGSVSLAHLRQSQSSSPHSPQQVKLGLGPANLYQIKQVGNAQPCPQKDLVSSNSHGPLNTEGKNFFAGMSQGGSGFESPTRSRSDVNQGMSASENDMVLQSHARPSSALSNASSLCREPVDSDILLPTGITCNVEGGVFPQGLAHLTGNSHYDVANDSILEAESSTTLDAKLKSPAVSSKLAPYHASSSREWLSTMFQHANLDSKSLCALQNQQNINMALNQLGGKVQPGNFGGLWSPLKGSLAEHSKDSGLCEKSLSRLADSSALVQDARDLFLSRQAPHLVSKTSVKQGHADEEFPPHLRSAGLSASKEYNQNLNPKPNNGIDSSTVGLLHSNDNALQSGPPGARQQALTTTNPTLAIFTPARDPNTQQQSSGQGKHVQQQSVYTDILSNYQVSQVTTADSMQAAMIADTAGFGDESIGAKMKLSTGSLTGGYLFYGDDSAIENMSNSSTMQCKTNRQENTFTSSFKPIQQPERSSQQPIDTSSFRPVQQPTQRPTASAMASSLPCTDGVCNSGSANDVQLLCSIGLPLDAPNNLVLHPQKPKQGNLLAHERSENCSTNILATRTSQPAVHIDTLLNRNGNINDVKAEAAAAGGNGDFATLDGFAPCQGSSSKTSLPGLSAIQTKKRKKPMPLLIPWYIAATQPRDSLPSASEMELIWANTAHRLADKDDGDCHKVSIASGMKARRRLRLTTQLMQQLTPPPMAGLIHGNNLVDIECSTFNVAKFALEDACRLVTNTRKEATSSHDCTDNKNLPLRGQQRRTWGYAKSVAVTRCVDSFLEKARVLEDELARIETSTSVSDLCWDICDTEKLLIVNRLANHHGPSFSADSAELCASQSISDCTSGVLKASLKKYVTVAPMPRALPGVKCLSL